MSHRHIHNQQPTEKAEGQQQHLLLQQHLTDTTQHHRKNDNQRNKKQGIEWRECRGQVKHTRQRAEQRTRQIDKMDFPDQIDHPGTVIGQPLLEQQRQGNRQHVIGARSQVIPHQRLVGNQQAGLAFGDQHQRRREGEQRNTGKSLLFCLEQRKNNR